MLRTKDWLFSKIPFMFMPLLIYFFDHNKYQNIVGLGVCLQYFIFITTFYGFGYAINDFSDKEIDRKVGKKNVMSEISLVSGIAILGILLLGCVPFLVMNFSIQTLMLFGFVYFWGAAYSIRPFRFKERGVAGLLVSSLAQRTIPLLPLLCFDANIWKIILVWGILGFFVGLRYILIHQCTDIENDKKSGTKTFVSERSHNITILIYISIFVELLIIVGTGVSENVGVYWLFMSICLLQSTIIFYTIHNLYKKSYFTSFICVPLEDMYNFYLPLALLILLTEKQIYWIAPVIILLLICRKEMCEKWKIVFFGVTHWRK